VRLDESCISITIVGSAESLEGLVVVQGEDRNAACVIGHVRRASKGIQLIRKLKTTMEGEYALHQACSAAAVEWTGWGVGSTITTVAALWRAKVDTRTPIIWFLAGADARRRCMVTVRGGRR